MAEADIKSNLNKITSKYKYMYHKNEKTSSRLEYVLQKTIFQKPNKKGKHILVNNKTHFKAQLYKCEKRFDNGASELIIHGLGAAIYKAVSLALRLREIHYGCLDFDIKTSTMQLKSELKSISGDMNEINRQNSAIHIRVFRKVPVALLRSTN